MIDHKNKYTSTTRKAVKGRGVINTLINKLPIELHLPGYQYCGPGTKLSERLARGDPGINLLDQACKEHDIGYSKFKETADRHILDKILAEKAWQRVRSADAGLSERANALLVTNMMKAKVKLGMGMKNKPKFGTIVSKVRRIVKRKKPDTMKASIKVALAAAKNITKGRKKTLKTPRIIPIPKVGGVLPFLVPLFAGLSAIGALSGGAAGIAKAVNDATNAKKTLEEKQRHNQKMEEITLGRGLHLKPYRKGLGLFLNPASKNF